MPKCIGPGPEHEIGANALCSDCENPSLNLTKEDRALIRIALCAYGENRRAMLAAVERQASRKGGEHLDKVLDSIQAEIDAAAALHVRLIQFAQVKGEL